MRGKWSKMMSKLRYRHGDVAVAIGAGKERLAGLAALDVAEPVQVGLRGATGRADVPSGKQQNGRHGWWRMAGCRSGWAGGLWSCVGSGGRAARLAGATCRPRQACPHAAAGVCGCAALGWAEMIARRYSAVHTGSDRQWSPSAGQVTLAFLPFRGVDRWASRASETPARTAAAIVAVDSIDMALSAMLL